MSPSEKGCADPHVLTGAVWLVEQAAKTGSMDSAFECKLFIAAFTQSCVQHILRREHSYASPTGAVITSTE